MSDNSKNKIYKGIGLIAGIIIIICCITLNIFTKNSLYNGKIANNIFIQGIDVSNMTKSEAIEVVNKKYTPQNLNLVYQDNSYEIDYKDIDLKSLNLSSDTKKVQDLKGQWANPQKYNQLKNNLQQEHQDVSRRNRTR